MPNRNHDTAPGRTTRAPVFPRARYVVRAAAVFFACATAGLLLASGKMQCGFARLLHIPCPGCGTTRAVWALLRLDPIGALRFNPLAPFVTGLLFLLALYAVYVTARDGNIERIGERPYGAWILKLLVLSLVLEILVWALRFLGLFGGPVAV
jgi:hypothetical protein